MRIRLLRFALFLALLCATAEAGAQNLPPPRVLPAQIQVVPPIMPPAFHPLPPSGPPVPLAFLPPVPYRPSAYRWQYYGRNYSGQLRPLVIQTNQGGYFLYNGYPFPYVHVYPGEHFGSMARY